MADNKGWWKALGSLGSKALGSLGPIGAISTGVGTALNLAKGIFGAVQYFKGKKEEKKLMANQPVYKRPEEYEQELAMRKQMAAQGAMPGQGYMEQNIGQAFAEATQGLKETAISSNVLNQGIGDLFSKKTQAYRDLGIQSAQWQQGMKENLMKTLQAGAGYSDTEWEQNKLRPWEIGMNRAEAKQQSGIANLFGGAEGALGNITSFVGTGYYNKILGELMKIDPRAGAEIALGKPGNNNPWSNWNDPNFKIPEYKYPGWH